MPSNSRSWHYQIYFIAFAKIKQCHQKMLLKITQNPLIGQTIFKKAMAENRAYNHAHMIYGTYAPHWQMPFFLELPFFIYLDRAYPYGKRSINPILAKARLIMKYYSRACKLRLIWVLGQQGFIIILGHGIGKLFQKITHIPVRLKIICRGCFKQAIDGSTGGGTIWNS